MSKPKPPKDELLAVTLANEVEPQLFAVEGNSNSNISNIVVDDELREEIETVHVLMQLDLSTKESRERVEDARAAINDISNRVYKVVCAWPAGTDLLSRCDEETERL